MRRGTGAPAYPYVLDPGAPSRKRSTQKTLYSAPRYATRAGLREPPLVALAVRRGTDALEIADVSDPGIHTRATFRFSEPQRYAPEIRLWIFQKLSQKSSSPQCKSGWPATMAPRYGYSYPLSNKAGTNRIHSDVMAGLQKRIAHAFLLSQYVIVCPVLQRQISASLTEVSAKKLRSFELVRFLRLADENQVPVIRHQAIDRTAQPVAHGGVEQNLTEIPMERRIEPASGPALHGMCPENESSAFVMSRLESRQMTLPLHWGLMHRYGINSVPCGIDGYWDRIELDTFCEFYRNSFL